MKKILLGLILPAVPATLFSIGYMTGTNTEPEADSISESLPPSKNFSTDSSSADNNSGKFAGIFGEWDFTVKNPKFVMQWQSADDFFMELYAKYDSFGFEDEEKVPLIEIKKKKRDLGVGSRFWIKDEDHIVIFGPQYYLAERQ